MEPNKKPKKRFPVDSRPILLVLTGLGFLSVILAATIMAAVHNLNSGSGYAAGFKTNGTTISQTPASASGDMMLAVVEKVDTSNQQITLFDVYMSQALELSYNGGTNITDQYGQLISMNQIEQGSMVDASYDPLNSVLNSMNISKKAWEYPKVKNLTVDKAKNTMKIASTLYKFTDDIFVLDGTDFVPVDHLAPQDVLTVWGDQETIWSIIVTTGHGTVKLEDYNDYLDDVISIGYESMMQITDDFSATVREGIFNLTVENGRYSATKSVTVLRDQVTYVSLADIGPVGLKQCNVTFEITPSGADLYIDNALTSYIDPVELSYGHHTIVASLGGYTTYQGTIDLDSKSKTIKIDLPEATSNQNPSASESNTSPDTGENSDTGNDSDDGNTGSSPSGNDNSSTSEDIKYSDEKPNIKLDDGDSLDSAHKIYIKAPDGASVYLDGDYMGTAPCKFDKIIGNHVLTFIKKGYKTMSYTVDVSDDKLDAYFTFPSLVKSE